MPGALCRSTICLPPNMTHTQQDSTHASEGFSLIPNQRLFSLYAAMRACRKAVEAAVAAASGKAKTHSILGHEAAIAGTVIDLRADDKVVSTLLSETLLRTVNPGVPLVSEQISSVNKIDGVTIVVCASRTLGLASGRKVLDRAIREKLPILFVSLDGLDARPLSYQPPKIRGYAFPSITVDGHDVVAVYRVASEAIAHARKGHGPTLIESVHVGPGCPLSKMEDYLAAKGLALPF